MESANKLLTISIPTWNRGTLIKELLYELTWQVIKYELTQDIEIIVSDNASDDDTEIIVKEFTNKCSFVSYNRNPFNTGANANVMKAMELASSQFVIFLGDDDRINEDCLVRVIEFLKFNKDIGVIVDISGFNKRTHFQQGVIGLDDLLKYFYWYIGNAGVFVVRSSFVKENLNRVGADFFNECWSQTQFMILGLHQHKNLKAYIANLKIISHSVHPEVMMYNSFYLWRGLYFELFNAINGIKNVIDKSTYLAGRQYLKRNIGQVLFNVLQCGIFVDENEVRIKTKQHIQKNINRFSFYEKIFLEIMIIALSIPNAWARKSSDIFIFMLKGKKGIKKKNDFVRLEKAKREKAETQKSIGIRKLEFEIDNY